MEPRSDSALVLVGSVEEVRAAGKKVVQVGRARVLVLIDGNTFRALDNRCPHMGFPLDQGDLHDGLLDCHWHHARFDISCGATLDPWADDAISYAVVVRDGDVFVDSARPVRDPREHGLARLARGLEDDLALVIAKAVIELVDGGVPVREPVAVAARFGATQRDDGWQPGLSILAAVGNVLDDLEPADRPRALSHAIRRIADDCAGRPPRRPLERLEGTRRDAAGLRVWFRETVEVRDADAAERVLASIAEEHGPRAALDAVVAAATDHRYAESGHVLDYAVKCAELSDLLGGRGGREARDTVPLLFTSLVPALTTMQRMEETSAWRRPVDVAALVDKGAERLKGVEFRLSARTDELPLADEDALVERILGEDPEAAIAALVARLRDGQSPVALADAVVSAAVLRVLRFGTSNETPDWDTVHHTLTYANAVAEAMRRVPSLELFRAVLDGAMSVFLDRFLNLPPAPLPRAADASTGTPVSPDALRIELLAAYDRRSAVQTVAALASRVLVHAQGRPEKLLGTLGHAVLREDAGFHEFQQLEIARRRLVRRGPAHPTTRLALIACARWLAAQYPTRRAREQTFLIAGRLHRGDALHEA